jgi:hypothetical protein
MTSRSIRAKTRVISSGSRACGRYGAMKATQWHVRPDHPPGVSARPNSASLSSLNGDMRQGCLNELSHLAFLVFPPHKVISTALFDKAG